MSEARRRAAGTLAEAAGELQRVAARLLRLAEAEELRALGAAGTGEVHAAQVRALIGARRLWGQALDLDEAADPAWALLLELFARRLEGRPIAISALAEAAGVPPTTSLRWIGRLHDSGLLARPTSPTQPGCQPPLA